MKRKITLLQAGLILDEQLDKLLSYKHIKSIEVIEIKKETNAQVKFTILVNGQYIIRNLFLNTRLRIIYFNKQNDILPRFEHHFTSNFL